MDNFCTIPDSVFLETVDFGPQEKGDVVGRFVTDCPSRHFLEDYNRSAALARREFPEAVAQTIELADSLCRHEFRILGKSVAFGEFIDWYWNPDGRSPWPASHVDEYGSGFWEKEDRLGDAKYPWELNRHQYFVTLAKAYRYTDDERYVQEIIDQLLDWRARNPVRHGINWTSELELAIRMISWINTLWLVRDNSLFRRRALQPILAGLYEHARYLNMTLTTDWFVRSNHIIGETAALFVFATLFPMFPESGHWRRRSLRIFAKEIAQQVWSDGVSAEQSTSYQRFVVDFLLLVFLIGEQNGAELPPLLRERLEKMLEYEQAVITPDGATPVVGDCDGGRGMLLSESIPFMDFRAWQAVGSVLFDRKDFRHRAAGGNEEALWTLGPQGWKLFCEKKNEAPKSRSSLFREGGQALLRAGKEPRETTVLVRCGRFGLGLDGASSHSHADLLAPCIHWRGLPLAVDTGTYSYYGDTRERDASRSAAAHNTMTPRGTDQAYMFPVWHWKDVPTTDVAEWNTSDGRTRLTAVCRTKMGFSHTRTFTLQDDPLRLVVEDHLQLADGEATAPIDWRLHLAPGLFILENRESHLIVGSTAAPLIILRCEGFDEVAELDTWYFPTYGVKEANKLVQLTVFGTEVKTRVVIEDFSPEENSL